MSEINPYKPPSSHVADVAVAAAGNFIAAGRAVDTGHGWDWIAAAYGLFKKQPGTWILILIIAFVLVLIVSRIPFGGFVSGVLFPVLAGGVMLGCKALDEEGALTVGHLFAGFRHNAGNLALVGVIWAAVSLAISAPVMLFAVGAGYWKILGGGTPDPAMFGLRFLLAILIVLALMLPVYMAVWFAPALVVLNDLTPVEAMKTSFRGCLKNILPFAWFSVLVILLYVAAVIPVLLGLLVYFPVMVISGYTAYRDIFFEA
jgi:hypothetical protein